MIEILAGISIALFVTGWVLYPVVRHAPPRTVPPSCPTCGPRPEPDAVFCSQCGAAISG